MRARAIHATHYFTKSLFKEGYKRLEISILEEVTQDGLALGYVPYAWRAHKEIVLAAVTQNGLALQYADAIMRADRDVVLAAVAQDYRALYYADKTMQAYKEVVLAAAAQDYRALFYAGAKMKADKEVVLAAVAQDYRALEYADKTMQADKEVVLAAVAQNGLALQYADKTMLADKEVVLAAVKQDYRALQYADKTMLADKEVVLAAVKQNGSALYYADKTMLADKEVVLAAVAQDGRALVYANATMQADKEVVLAAVTQDGLALYHAHDDLKKDKEVVLAALAQDGRALQYAGDDLRKDKKVVLVAVAQNGLALRYADAIMKADQEVVLEAVKQNSRALQYAGAKMKADQEVVLAAVAQDYMALQYADKTMQADKEVVSAAVAQNGLALQYADATIQADRDIVLAAVTQNGLALQHADETIQADKEVVLAAVTQNGLALEYADATIQADKGIVLAAVAQDGLALYYAHDDLKKDKEFMLKAVTQNGLALEYADETMKADKGIVLAAVTQNGLALEYADATIQADKGIVLAAVAQDGLALYYAHDDLKKDKEVVLAAVTQDGLALQYAGETMQKDIGLQSIAKETGCDSQSENIILFKTKDPSLCKLLQSFSDPTFKDPSNSYRFRIPANSPLATCLQQPKVKSFIKQDQHKTQNPSQRDNPSTEKQYNPAFSDTARLLKLRAYSGVQKWQELLRKPYDNTFTNNNASRSTEYLTIAPASNFSRVRKHRFGKDGLTFPAIYSLLFCNHDFGSADLEARLDPRSANQNYNPTTFSKKNSYADQLSYSLSTIAQKLSRNFYRDSTDPDPSVQEAREEFSKNQNEKILNRKIAQLKGFATQERREVEYNEIHLPATMILADGFFCMCIDELSMNNYLNLQSFREFLSAPDDSPITHKQRKQLKEMFPKVRNDEGIKKIRKVYLKNAAEYFKQIVISHKKRLHSLMQENKIDEAIILAIQADKLSEFTTEEGVKNKLKEETLSFTIFNSNTQEEQKIDDLKTSLDEIIEKGKLLYPFNQLVSDMAESDKAESEKKEDLEKLLGALELFAEDQEQTAQLKQIFNEEFERLSKPNSSVAPVYNPTTHRHPPL